MKQKKTVSTTFQTELNILTQALGEFLKNHLESEIQKLTTEIDKNKKGRDAMKADWIQQRKWRNRQKDAFFRTEK